MRLADLLYALPPVVPAQPAFPRRLLGAFRRKSITFCTGVTAARRRRHIGVRPAGLGRRHTVG